MLSVSLIVLEASGSVKVPRSPRLTFLVFSSTTLTCGWTCRMMLPSSSICGVTSSEIPEKKGCSVMFGVTTLPAALVVVLVLMPVTK